MGNFFEKLKIDLTSRHSDYKSGVVELLKYIGPGLLVTVGFIDPGNWASNFAAGSEFGYSLLWVVTLSTVMLTVLQHNVAHLGIVTGLCLSEAANKYLPRNGSRFVLWSAIAASVSTSLAEILGGAIALEMLFKIPVKGGAVLVTVFVFVMICSNSYKKIERYVIAFVSVIGLSFIYELFLIDVDWGSAASSCFAPSIPKGSLLLIMSVLGAVVMPHNLFLHSEIIQSREWNKLCEKEMKSQLKFEFMDTIFSMGIGWAINCAMILLAAAAFFKNAVVVDDLQQAQSLLHPLLGNNAAAVFAIALLFAGISSSITSGIAAGSIFAGMNNEPYNIKNVTSRVGVIISLGIALVILFFVNDPFKGLIISQAVLSLQLPVTVFTQLKLTSSKMVMGKYANKSFTKFLLYVIAILVALLNALLLVSFLFNLSI